MKLKDYFGNFWTYKQKEGLSPHTLGEYKRFLYGALSHCPIQDKKIKQLRLTDVAEVIESGRRHGENGPTRSVSTFRQLMKYLEDSGQRLPFNWTRIKVPAPPEHEQEYLTEREFEDFMAKIPLNNFYGLRDRTLYETLWSTGLRIGELLAIKKPEIDWNMGEVAIKTFKGGEEGKVYFSERCLDWLKKYLEARGNDNCEALFISYNQGIKQLTHNSAKKNLLNWRRKCGLTKKITHHAFRRGFCTMLLEKGATIREVQFLARHKSARTTLRFYCKFEKTKAKETHNRIFGAVDNSTI